MSVTDDQQFCLRWNNFQTYITSQFETLRDDEDFVDVTLACEGQRLGAHKVVLSACSPFFKELFKTNPCRHPIVFMRDVEVRHIVALLEFMYAGEVNVAQTHLPGFLRTAESLQIRGLTDAASTTKDHENQIEAQPTSTQLPISPPPAIKSQKPKPPPHLKSRASPSRTVTSSQEKSPDSPEPPRKRPKDDETTETSPIGTTTTLAPHTDADTPSPAPPDTNQTQINPFAVETKKLHSEIDISTELIEPKLELPDYSEDELTNPDDTKFLDADPKHTFANLSGGMEIIPGTSGMGDISQESEQDVDREVCYEIVDEFAEKPITLETFSVKTIYAEVYRRKKKGWKTCNYCGKHISTNSNLQKHILRMHSVQPSIQCSLCCVMVKNKYAMRDHIRTKHDARAK